MSLIEAAENKQHAAQNEPVLRLQLLCGADSGQGRYRLSKVVIALRVDQFGCCLIGARNGQVAVTGVVTVTIIRASEAFIKGVIVRPYL